MKLSDFSFLMKKIFMTLVIILGSWMLFTCADS